MDQGFTYDGLFRHYTGYYPDLDSLVGRIGDRWIEEESMRLPNAIRKWKFLAYDGDHCFYLGDDVCFVGTSKEVDARADILIDEYEREYGFIEAITLESQGIMWQGPGKDGGLA
jgi:hypothetical protein